MFVLLEAIIIGISEFKKDKYNVDEAIKNMVLANTGNIARERSGSKVNLAYMRTTLAGRMV